MLFSAQMSNNASYPITLEWLNNTDVKITFTPLNDYPAIAFAQFKSVAGGTMYIRIQVSTLISSGNRMYEYADEWYYIDYTNGDAYASVDITGVTSQ